MPWYVYALLSAVFAAAVAILGKIGVANINSNLATAIRTVVILIFAWGIVFAQGTYKHIGSIPKNTIIFLVLSGIATGLSWLFYFRALQLGTASQVAPIDKFSLVLTIIFALIFLKEKVTVSLIGGVILITIGIFLVLFNK
ncbi:MAG: EamA family transporter [Candidatus Gottesmanbacteria bacterium]